MNSKMHCFVLVLIFMPLVEIFCAIDDLASSLLWLAQSAVVDTDKEVKPLWDKHSVYRKDIGSVHLVVVVGNATDGDMLNQDADVVVGNATDGDMLNQDADVVVDAANGDLMPGTGVSGALYAAAGSPDVDKVWRKNRPPLISVHQKGVPPSEKRLNDGDAWFNTNPEVLAYRPDKGSGVPQNIMRIAHAVAPVCSGTVDAAVRDLLVSAYKNALKEIDAWLQQDNWLAGWNAQRQAAGVSLRGENHEPAIAFPLLGAGVFGCDGKMVAESFLKALLDYTAEVKDTRIRVVILAPFRKILQDVVLGVMPK